MLNIHEMATMWPMQTLGSFDLLYWKTCDQERRCIFMALLQEWLVLSEIMLSMFNKMINLYFQFV